jgi:hypothetical protein
LVDINLTKSMPHRGSRGPPGTPCREGIDTYSLLIYGAGDQGQWHLAPRLSRSRLQRAGRGFECLSAHELPMNWDNTNGVFVRTRAQRWDSHLASPACLFAIAADRHLYGRVDGRVFDGTGKIDSGLRGHRPIFRPRARRYWSLRLLHSRLGPERPPGRAHRQNAPPRALTTTKRGHRA